MFRCTPTYTLTPTQDHLWTRVSLLVNIYNPTKNPEYLLLDLFETLAMLFWRTAWPMWCRLPPPHLTPILVDTFRSMHTSISPLEIPLPTTYLYRQSWGWYIRLQVLPFRGTILSGENEQSEAKVRDWKARRKYLPLCFRHNSNYLPRDHPNPAFGVALMTKTHVGGCFSCCFLISCKFCLYGVQYTILNLCVKFKVHFSMAMR